MRKFLFWTCVCISVVSAVGAIATIEALNWIPLSFAILCVFFIVLALYVAEPEYISKILNDD